MSSTVANGLVHKAFCSQASPGDTHSKSFTRPSRSTLVRVGSGPRGDHRLVYHRRRLVLVNKFIGKALVHRSAAAQFPGQRRGASVMAPRAVLAADPASEVSTKLRLDGQSELQITINASNPGLMQINLSVANTSGRLVLHWGIIREGEKDWRLPSRRPNGTQLYKNKALRTPFVTSGPNANLQIEIDEPGIEAMEFLVVDESQNRWFKDNGQNFRLALPRKLKSAAVPPVERNKNVSLPEDLVQIQAYLRWERRGKQNYTPDQEKIEYEAARTELLEEIARGKSIEELRAKLTKPSDNGNEQKGDVQAKVTQQLQTKKHFSGERIQRKNRDLKQFLNKYPIVFGDETRPPPSVKASTHLELFAEAVVEKDGGVVLNKKIYKLDNKEILALATTSLGKTKIYVALDQSGPYILHWALSKKGKEWMAPPPSTAPPNSTFLELACETPFTSKTTEEPHYKVAAVEIEINEKEFRGMPFVIREGQNWIKNNGFDFYVDLSLKTEDTRKVVHDGKGTAKAFLDVIAQSEDDAQRSLMHRFNIAADLMGKAKDHGILGVAGLLVWLRFMSTRQLVWNKNYNVKPREISKAQDRLTDLLQDTYAKLPQYREMLRLIMACVGRGGEGDVGQRIRDEILVIQRNNDCKGGMMEEWHQKLHNNTSPDDVVICQALMDYIKNGFDINVYWNTLKSNGITKERLLSYDRAIHSEPNFRHDQKEGLLRDLGHYMRTLKAVHSGADLESAIATSLGYQSEGQGFMVGVQINPIRGLPSGFPGLLKFVLVHVEDAEVEGLLEGLLEAREELRPLLLQPHERLKDLLFLDIALDSTVRTAIERGYEQLHNASPEKIMYFITLVLENLALSTDDNEDLLYCLKGWNYARDMVRRNDDQWALFAKSCLDRTRLALASKSELYTTVLQPSAEYLGSQLNVEPWAIDIFTEEIIRAGSAASLSGLLNRLDPTLRKVANLGSWQVISPVEVAGYIETVDELITVQDKLYERPTILIAKSVKGEEEIPDGTVAVLTPDMPDVLSHVSVRARNSKVCFATCFDPNILKDLQKNEGKLFRLKPTSADVTYGEIKESELSNGNGSLKDESAPSLSLSKKQFSGRYAISLQDFDGDLVGAKSRNIGLLKGKVPSWLVIPTSVAIPFGVFEKVLSDDSNKEVAKELETLKTRVNEGDFGALPDIRREVLQLRAPSQLVLELKEKMKESGMPWPGDEGERRWEQAWLAIKKVWASKWNERAYFSTKKVKLDHDYLCMAVLVQEIISADYAFVIHTTNPSSGDASEIYAEVVKGLGETLVGAYPGRALSFICKKNDLNSPKVTGYPSKPIGLFIRPSLIFRSDSNGEDLEGYAGAGLYDSVPMDEEDEVVLDYASDPLIVDANFRKTILSAIARAGSVIEELYGSPQDIEGVVKGGKIIVVQTRPQM